ncbi:MAG TPA: ABC transporter substrate-binding protein [Chloroflexota bacterium]|nr:ABC transporter substrate-binding protein [Chloroflexota bacterium]
MSRGFQVFLKLGAVGALLLMVACSSAVSPTPAPSVPATPTQTSVTSPVPVAPAPGQTVTVPALATPVPVAARPSGPPDAVRVGMSQEPDTISGFPGGMYVARIVQNLIFDELVGMNDQMRPVANLVEVIPSTENGLAKFVGEGADQQLQVTFKLRKDATWADGQPFTSRDVQFTYDLLMNPDSNPYSRELERKYEKVETTDDHTVLFTFFSEKSAREAASLNPARYEEYKDQNGPVVDPTYLFGIQNSWIYPAHILAPLVDNNPRTSVKVKDLFTRSDYARKPIGTGAYALSEWTVGKRLVLEARDSYHLGAPKIKQAIFTIVPKTDLLIDQLTASEIDLITLDALDTAHVPVLDGLPNVQAHFVTGTAWEHIDFNLDHPLLTDRRVRQAIAHAINRGELIEKVFYGKAAAVHSVIMDWSWAHNADVPKYDYDPRKAESLLEEAGWRMGVDGIREKDGQKLSLRFQTTDSPTRMRVSPLLKNQLAAVGIDLKIEHLSTKDFFGREGVLAQGSFELSQYAWIGGYDPGASSSQSYHSRNIPTRESNFFGSNYPRYRSEDADRLLDDGLATLDPAKRTQSYKDFQRQVMVDLPALPLFARPNTTAVSSRVLGVKPGRSSIGETWNIHEWTLVP